MHVDHHVHSTYSDGRFMWAMCQAAADAGLDGIGIADHANVSTRDRYVRTKAAMGFNLDVTYERRRAGIEMLRERFDLEIYDAVELDFDSHDVPEIEAFLAEAGFDYAIGSVHYLDGTNVHFESYFSGKSEAERADLVETFFDKTVALLETELFDIAAHVDLVERNPALRGFATEEQYRRVADAAAASNTLIEINAGRALDEYGEFHPTPDFLDELATRDVDFVCSTDAHAAAELGERVDELERFVESRGLDPVTVEATRG
ncbi:MAG: PHP domain-containing protein [Natronomonas sp.]